MANRLIGEGLQGVILGALLAAIFTIGWDKFKDHKSVKKEILRASTSISAEISYNLNLIADTTVLLTNSNENQHVFNAYALLRSEALAEAFRRNSFDSIDAGIENEILQAQADIALTNDELRHLQSAIQGIIAEPRDVHAALDQRILAKLQNTKDQLSRLKTKL